jgi:hypothetical protein
MKYILAVLLFCLIVPSVASASFNFTNGGVAIMHSNCSETDYIAASNSDIARGTVLRQAVAAAVAGDTLYLSANTFDIGNAGITLPTSVSLYGYGIDITIIKSQLAGGLGGAIVVPGTNSTIGYLTVNGNEGTHQLQLPIGFYQGINTIPTSFTVEYVKLVAETDGFYFYSTSTAFTANIFNSTTTTKWDSLALDSSGSTVNVYSSSFNSIGPYSSPVMGTAAVARGGGGTLNLYNSSFTAINNNSNYGILAWSPGVVNAYNCTASSPSSPTHTYSDVVSAPSLPAETCQNPLNGRKILSFNFTTPSTTGVIDNTNHTVSLLVLPGTNLTSLSPVITVSPGATISPASGISKNFTSPQTYTVTALDGTSTQNYIATATIASTDATLSNLTISSGTLTPPFLSSTTSYTDSVANDVSSMTITPTVNQANATVTVNGTPVTSGSASSIISLNEGDNTITTAITAQDGTTTKTYVIIVTRASGGGETTFPISVYVTPNGSIIPGSQNIVQGDNFIFNIAPNTGYQIADVLVDNVSVGAVSTYTFSKVIKPHTILANFSVVTSTDAPASIINDSSTTIITLKQQIVALLTQIIQLLQAKILVLTHK